MGKEKLRVVCLFGTGIIFDKTLSILLENNVNVVGVCNANKHKKGIDFSYLKIAGKKYGWGQLFLQIIGRIYYRLLNRKKDIEIFNQIYNKQEINSVINQYNFETFATENYGSPETIAWIKSLKPDLLVVHTGYWVGKKVRDIVGGKVIGGHPGITPDYRGVHSPFWAIYNNEPEKVGYTAFWLDSGVDTGDILHQDTVTIEKGDSFFTLSWKGMVGIAKAQAKIINKIDNGEELFARKISEVDEKTNYTHPTIFQYLEYKQKQKKVR
ncbi:formyl transferase [Chishuiella sp.]|uniref:formyl transferase n=1 Tax=Chishuiella sp. TaxID=1969467 RepID=UPI0028AC1561|nr:formyl transferase [Chishuiella sp.]